VNEFIQILKNPWWLISAAGVEQFETCVAEGNWTLVSVNIQNTCFLCK
jgi:hypothetical protein